MSKGYKVGYGKPPQHTKFPKGKSGNPKGRPKAKSREVNVISELQKGFLGKTLVTSDGTKVEMSLLQAFLKKCMSEVGKGNMRAAEVLANLLVKVMPAISTAGTDRDPDESKNLTPADAEILAAYDRQILDKSSKAGGP